MNRFLPLLLTLFALLAGGCATSSTQVQPFASLEGRQRFFVLANANDNRAVDRRIANALRARGFTAEHGPRTMMPDDTQVLVTYEDRWSWDFGDRLNYFRLTVRDARNAQPLAGGEYFAKIPGRQSLDDLIATFLDRMLAGKK